MGERGPGRVTGGTALSGSAAAVVRPAPKAAQAGHSTEPLIKWGPRAAGGGHDHRVALALGPLACWEYGLQCSNGEEQQGGGHDTWWGQRSGPLHAVSTVCSNGAEHQIVKSSREAAITTMPSTTQLVATLSWGS